MASNWQAFFLKILQKRGFFVVIHKTGGTIFPRNNLIGPLSYKLANFAFFQRFNNIVKAKEPIYQQLINNVLKDGGRKPTSQILSTNYFCKKIFTSKILQKFTFRLGDGNRPSPTHFPFCVTENIFGTHNPLLLTFLQGFLKV